MIVPHLALPFSVSRDGTANVLEQDSLGEITQCVSVLVGTTLGERIEQPDYGVPDQTFRTEIERGAILQAIEEWEPRALATLEDHPDALDELVRHVQVSVGRGGE